MTEADRVHSTPPLNSSSTQDANPLREDARSSEFYGAECPSHPNCTGGCGLGCTHEIEQVRRSSEKTESGNLTSEFTKPAGGLSRRHMLAGLAVLPAAVPAIAVAAPREVDPIFAAIAECRAAKQVSDEAYEGEPLK